MCSDLSLHHACRDAADWARRGREGGARQGCKPSASKIHTMLQVPGQAGGRARRANKVNGWRHRCSPRLANRDKVSDIDAVRIEGAMAGESWTPTTSTTVAAATAAADPSCPPFLLLEEEEKQGSQKHEQPQEELPHGGELELPTVDLESPGEALAAACRQLGVFRIANHGVPAELSARLFELARDLLGRSLFQEKQGWPGYFWGTPALTLRVKDVNWVEGFHVALGQKWPIVVGPPISEFGDVASEYGEHMARVARKLFDALAAALVLDADQTASYLAERDGTLRVYRYPPCSAPSGSHHLGMEAHTDSSVLTIINQDLVGGLQVLHEGSWRDVPPAAGGGDTDTLLVNLGDMAQAISGDAYRSARHRVAASRDAERISLCYFAFPRDEAVLRSGGSRYRPFSYAEFREQVQADIKATGSKVGLERFLRH